MHDPFNQEQRQGKKIDTTPLQHGKISMLSETGKQLLKEIITSQQSIIVLTPKEK